MTNPPLKGFEGMTEIVMMTENAVEIMIRGITDLLLITEALLITDLLLITDPQDINHLMVVETQNTHPHQEIQSLTEIHDLIFVDILTEIAGQVMNVLIHEIIIDNHANHDLAIHRPLNPLTLRHHGIIVNMASYLITKPNSR
eukprot:CAMPEP_0117039620 /NCGR_PEP_ID=MMETSP0472-20121206/27796_1 /TAXON_ID=693140 ORGANISM="Tiarina fusus, Strain LIS" /NCGR_SAMPLE_ID=MMETSP0472 /ASSEMBLY_ACC=CAM_ASM_000603 /LENGTH=142 /DNA_ID=CAMNT_0004750163 /DNA_START=1164 /DNA_END=1592 /DNA_ORIENTATION=+